MYHPAVSPSRFAPVLASVLALALLSAAPVLAQAPPAPAPPSEKAAGPEADLALATAPVLLDGEALFRVRGTSTYPAEERARRIAGRIEEVARTASIAPETVQAVPADELVNIAAGDRFLRVLDIARRDALALLSAPLLGACARRAAAPGPRRPHIVILVVDALRQDFVGCYGGEGGATAAIDRIAAEGVRFANAYANAPWTLPSHASLFTGLPPEAHRQTHAAVEDTDGRIGIAASARFPGRCATFQIRLRIYCVKQTRI